MSKNKNHCNLAAIAIIAFNIIVFLGWIHLAIHFNKWWIMLLCWMGMMSYSSKSDDKNPVLSQEEEIADTPAVDP